jgi:uncharacterized protein (TIGR03085 family)
MKPVELLDAERNALCETLRAVGPEAPTLCTGWLTADLAAHLLVREKRLDAGPGIVLGGPFAAHTRKVMETFKARGYDVMVAELHAGPPPWFRTRLTAPPNVVENWIHHEDVRRANGESPRPADFDIDELLWKALRTSALVARFRVKGAGIVLRVPEGRERVVKPHEKMVTVTGRPGELLLFMTGRQEAADVLLDGEPEAVALVRAARLGL